MDQPQRENDSEFRIKGKSYAFSTPKDLQAASKNYSTGRVTPQEFHENYSRFLERRREKMSDRASSLVKKILESEDLKLSQSTFKAGPNKQISDDGFQSPYFQPLLGDLAQKIGMEI